MCCLLLLAGTYWIIQWFDAQILFSISEIRLLFYVKWQVTEWVIGSHFSSSVFLEMDDRHGDLCVFVVWWCVLKGNSAILCWIFKDTKAKNSTILFLIHSSFLSHIKHLLVIFMCICGGESVHGVLIGLLT